MVADSAFFFLKNCSTGFRNNLVPEVWAEEQDPDQRFTCKPVSPPPWCPCCQRVLLGIRLLPAPHPQGYQRPPASVYAAFALPSKAKVVATEGFERDFYFLSSDLPGICILVKDRHFTLEVFKTGNRPFRSGGTSFFFFFIFSRINSGLFNSFLPPPFLSCH